MKNNEKLKLFEECRKHAVCNEIEILRSKKCGCFVCGKIFDARKVANWFPDKNGGVSAICPECGSPTVIGDASGLPLEKDFLAEMGARYAGLPLHEEKNARDFVDHYFHCEVPHNKEYEQLYVSGLKALAKEGEPKAFMLLGVFYSHGAEFQPLNPKLAVRYYSDPHVRNDTAALNALALIYLSGAVKSRNKMKGFELLARAAALGSMEAVYHMADCYLDGNEVEVDESFAFRLIQSAFSDLYPDFATKKQNWDVLPDFAVRMGDFYRLGLGPFQDDFLALRYYLLASVSQSVRDGILGKGVFLDYTEHLDQQIKLLAKSCQCQRGAPVLDSDTFFDTYGDPNTPDYSPKTFHLESYDPEEMTLSFTLESKEPGFLFDLASLYCAPSPSKVTWQFKDVAAFKAFGEGDLDFDAIVPHPDGDGWDFLKGDGNNDSTVVSIRLTPNESFKSVLESLEKLNRKKKSAKKKKTGETKKPAKKDGPKK